MQGPLSKAYVDAITRCHTGGSSGECKTRPVEALRFGTGYARGPVIEVAHAATRSFKAHMRSQARLMKFRRRAETALLRSCPL